jgi:tetratricopeptide (TPR) repeat protein
MAEDPIQSIRTALAAIRKSPDDVDARRRLHAAGANHAEQLAMLLADEARAARDPRVAAVFYAELADAYENLDQPIETIAAMEKVVELEPRDPEHHDRLAWLYRRSDAWIKAAESYERVADLSTDERGRAALRAAGKLYRDRGKLDRAADIYRQIVERRATDADAWRALDEILTALGRWRDAAEVRGERAARAKGVEKAALLRSQARALEQAGEHGKAASLVEQAQDHAPDNVSGLVDYAEVLAREGKGREAADILEKRIDDAVERGASTDDVAALRLRLFDIYDELKDRARTQLVMEDLMTAAPEYLPALERLAARAAKDLDPRAHGDALLRYAAAVPDPLSRGYAVLEAARKFRDVGDHAAAIAAYEDAATLVDDEAVRRELADARGASSFAALLAKVGQLEEAGKLDAAAEQLRAAIEDTGGQHAPLVFKLARVRQHLGDEDDAHTLLHEAYRLDRKSLEIQLALGESCFARKIWRQAALHLGALAEHPDAARHAAAVARGLVHAAQAETRALRPQNAAKHYEAAAKLDASCAPAWHALGEAAMERGEVAQAVDFLEREAKATTEPRDRLRLFDALGDLANDVLGDSERAERCWLQIADIADVPTLDKLVTVQRARGTVRGATSERLAELVADPKRKKLLVEEATAAYLRAAQLDSAVILAERLMTAHPRDASALAIASQVALAADDPKRAAHWLERAISTAHNPDAELHRLLGDAKRALGLYEAAIAAYRRTVIAAPESDAAMAARRGLIELASVSGVSAATSRVALVEAEQDPADVLAWARELAEAGTYDDARLAYDLARVLEAELSGVDEQFLAAHPTRPMASDEAYATQLDEAELRELVDDPDLGPIGELFEMLAEAAPLICPASGAALVDADTLEAHRISGTSDAAVAAIYPQIAKAIGGPATLLYTTPKKTHPDLALLYATPPVIVFGPQLAAVRARSHAEIAGERSLEGDVDLRFKLGRLALLSRPRHIFAAQPADQLDVFVRGMRYAFGPPGTKVERVVISAGDRLRSVTPVTLRGRLSEWFAAFAGDLYDREYQVTYLAALDRSADRAGLVACGDLLAAVAVTGGVDEARHLIELASSQRYLAARKKLRPRAVE